MKKWALLFPLALFFSMQLFAQNLSIKNKLKGANKIEIRFLKNKYIKVYRSQRPMDLIYLKELITKAINKPKLVCDTTGEIIYYKDNIQLFEVYFSTKSTGSKYFTSTIIFNDNNTIIKAWLNYGSGMLISEEYYKLYKH